MKLSKSNISNGETQAEVDPIDNNNEWKVSTCSFFSIYCKPKILLIYSYIILGS